MNVTQEQDLIQLELRKDNLCTQVDNMQIVDQDTLQKAADLTKWIKQLHDKIEEDRKEVTRGLNESLKKINERYKDVSEPLKSAERNARNKITYFMQNASQSAPARGEYGAVASMRGHWEYRITDIAKLAAAYPELVQGNVQAIKHMIHTEQLRELPGVEIYQDRRCVIR